MKSFGLNIKKIRERWRLSQEEFGYLIGATRGMIMQYEKRGSKPKNETVSQIMKLTGISKELLEGVGLPDNDLPEMSIESRIAIDNFRKDPEAYRDLKEDQTMDLLKPGKGESLNSDGTGDDRLGGPDSEFVEFLKSNDAFFKNQYTAFNVQVLANLTALQTHARNLEALLKITLEHTGNVEAHQLGVQPEEIHERINRDILAAAGVRIDNAVGSPGKG